MGNVTGALSTIVAFFGVGLIIAAIPTGIWILVDSRGIRTRRMKFAYASAGLLGGIAGDVIAICSLFLGVKWICWRGQQDCPDAATGMFLIYTIPLFSLGGCLLSLIWTRVSFKFASDRLLASVFLYNGANRWGNWMTRVGLQITVWLALLGGLTLLTIVFLGS